MYHKRTISKIKHCNKFIKKRSPVCISIEIFVHTIQKDPFNILILFEILLSNANKNLRGLYKKDYKRNVSENMINDGICVRIPYLIPRT